MILKILTWHWSPPLLWCQCSPAELLTGRQIGSVHSLCQPSRWFLNGLICKSSWSAKVSTVDKRFKQKRKKNFNQQHHAVELPTFSDDNPVFVATEVLFLPQIDLMRYEPPWGLSQATELIYILDQKWVHLTVWIQSQTPQTLVKVQLSQDQDLVPPFTLQNDWLTNRRKKGVI